MALIKNSIQFEWRRLVPICSTCSGLATLENCAGSFASAEVRTEPLTSTRQKTLLVQLMHKTCRALFLLRILLTTSTDSVVRYGTSLVKKKGDTRGEEGGGGE